MSQSTTSPFTYPSCHKQRFPIFIKGSVDSSRQRSRSISLVKATDTKRPFLFSPDGTVLKRVTLYPSPLINTSITHSHGLTTKLCITPNNHSKPNFQHPSRPSHYRKTLILPTQSTICIQTSVVATKRGYTNEISTVLCDLRPNCTLEQPHFELKGLCDKEQEVGE
jgi:hypothetical protein